MSQRIEPPARRGETLGVLLTRLRQAQGKSQVRLAGLLCAASGLPTLTRHEISRWEREERIPSRVWLDWLALVLDTPIDDLERAAALTRRRREPTMTLTTTPVTPAPGQASLSAAGDGGAGRGGRIAELRRMDDLIAGPELLALVLAELRAAARDTAAGRGAPVHVAELAQLHTWVAADAGRHPQDGVQRGGVRAALAAGDRALAGHLLGCRAQIVAERGDGPAALRIAAIAVRVAAGSDPATATMLSLRVAFAAAQAGDRRTCDTALASAEHAHARRVPGLDPPWLYWLDGAHVDALAGVSLATSGRPAAALPRLAAALRAPTVRLRAAGLVCAATAHAHLTAGDLDAACAAATEALLACVDSGSFRVLHRLRRLEVALRATAGSGRPAAVLRTYTELAAYLPGAAPAPSRPAMVIGSGQVPGRVAS
jgi:transcriptional regulator with XRE-family HTH domain